MKRILCQSVWALAFSLALTGSAYAQETTETPAEVPAGPNWNVIGTFGAWEVRCAKAEGGHCSAVLEVMESESRRVLLAWTFAIGREGNTVSVFYTPTGVRIQPGIEVRIDEGEPLYRAPYIGCRSEGCIAEGIMPPELLARVRTGAKARVVLVNLQGRAFNFDIPITGLDAALNALPQP